MPCRMFAVSDCLVVLLVFFFWLYKSTAKVSMKKYDGKVIDIGATAFKLGEKCSDLLAVHVLSGCDTVSYPYRKGKTSALNSLLQFDLNLKVFTEFDVEEAEWMKAGMNFLSYMYCGKIVGLLNTLRFTLFGKKKDSPKIKSLPPTDKSAVEHIRRARPGAPVFKCFSGEQLIRTPLLPLILKCLDGE